MMLDGFFSSAFTVTASAMPRKVYGSVAIILARATAFDKVGPGGRQEGEYFR